MPMLRKWFGLAAAVALAAGIAACSQDSIIRELGPDNDLQVTSEPDTFRVFADDLENVNDRRSYTFRNNNPRALFFHRNFLHHGYGLVVIRDAVGAVVDSTILEWELNTDTEVGVPGDWTIDLILSASRGRVDFSLKGVSEDEPIPEVD